MQAKLQRLHIQLQSMYADLGLIHDPLSLVCITPKSLITSVLLQQCDPKPKAS